MRVGRLRRLDGHRERWRSKTKPEHGRENASIAWDNKIYVPGAQGVVRGVQRRNPYSPEVNELPSRLVLIHQVRSRGEQEQERLRRKAGGGGGGCKTRS